MVGNGDGAERVIFGVLVVDDWMVFVRVELAGGMLGGVMRWRVSC